MAKPPTKAMAMIGQRFGMFTVVSADAKVAHCICDCGTLKDVICYSLRSGRSRSCGCTKSADVAKRFTTHGKSYTKAYKNWRGMIDRCTSKNHPAYQWYGAIGISVCERWRDKVHGFENFTADMGVKPTPQHSIDRINNDGNYEPGNCRWATKREQRLNTSTTIMIEFRGVRKSLSEWADEFQLPGYVIRKRLKKGWDVGKALETPLIPRTMRGGHNRKKVVQHDLV